MKKSVALLTPTYRMDLDRFALLCESVDRHVAGRRNHYVIVADSDLLLFSKFESDRRHILPASRFLPKWLTPLPFLRRTHGRRVWWSLRGGFVHGWHIQQILKCAGAASLPEDRYCVLDSDIVFFRSFDVDAYAGAERSPLFVEPKAITADAPRHAIWTKNCDRLLGLGETAFPADDYIGHAIVWDKPTVQEMLRTIERITGRGWAEALCRTRDFSEYLLYGNFVRNTPNLLAAHDVVLESLVDASWSEQALGVEDIQAMAENAAPGRKALSIASFSNTPVTSVCEAVGLANVREDASRRGLHAA